MKPTVTETGSGPRDTSRVAEVLAQIALAAEIAAEAERAYPRSEEGAGQLHAAAELAHRGILRSICTLTEAEADSVEPAFSEFENVLLRLSSKSAHPGLS